MMWTLKYINKYINTLTENVMPWVYVWIKSKVNIEVIKVNYNTWSHVQINTGSKIRGLSTVLRPHTHVLFR